MNKNKKNSTTQAKVAKGQKVPSKKKKIRKCENCGCELSDKNESTELYGYCDECEWQCRVDMGLGD